MACSSRFAHAAAASELSGPSLHREYSRQLRFLACQSPTEVVRWRRLWRRFCIFASTRQHHFLQAFLFPQLSAFLSSILRSFTLEQFLRQLAPAYATRPMQRPLPIVSCQRRLSHSPITRPRIFLHFADCCTLNVHVSNAAESYCTKLLLICNLERSPPMYLQPPERMMFTPF